MKDTTIVVVVLLLCMVNRGTCELGAPVYVANWGSASSNGSTTETPVNSLQLAVSISNNVFVLTNLSGSQCVQTIPTEYEQLRIQAYDNNEYAPSIQATSCTGPFMSVSNRSVTIEMQSVTLVCGMATSTPMIMLAGEQVVLRAENVQFMSSVQPMRGWLSVATGAAAYLTNCSMNNNRFDTLPLMQTTGDAQLVVVNITMLENSFNGNYGSCMSLPDSSSCVPEVLIGEGGSAAFDGCFNNVGWHFPSLYATANTSVQLIECSQLFSSVVSFGNVTLSLGPYTNTQFRLTNATLVVVPSPVNATFRDLPSLSLSYSVIYLPDIEVTSSQIYNGLTLRNSAVYGRGYLLNIQSVMMEGNWVTFYDCPINAIFADIGEGFNSYDKVSVTFIGTKGPSGADLVAVSCNIAGSAILQGSLTAENLEVLVPSVDNGLIAQPAYVQSFSGWSNSTIGVMLNSVGRFRLKVITVPVITIGSSSMPPSSRVEIYPDYDVKVKGHRWSRGTNSTTLKVMAEYTASSGENDILTVIIVFSILGAVVLGLSIWGGVVCCRRYGACREEEQPSYLAVTTQTGDILEYESI